MPVTTDGHFFRRPDRDLHALAQGLAGAARRAPEDEFEEALIR
jgi:hypothetical protein